MLKKKLASVMLVLAMVLGMSGTAFAAEDAPDNYIQEEESVASYWDPGFTESYFDGPGNMYTGFVFPTLTAAKSYFGIDQTYTQCNVDYGGHRFNCFYCFDDGTNCYFNVKDFWK